MPRLFLRKNKLRREPFGRDLEAATQVAAREAAFVLLQAISKKRFSATMQSERSDVILMLAALKAAAEHDATGVLSAEELVRVSQLLQIASQLCVRAAEVNSETPRR